VGGGGGQAGQDQDTDRRRRVGRAQGVAGTRETHPRVGRSRQGRPQRSDEDSTVTPTGKPYETHKQELPGGKKHNSLGPTCESEFSERVSTGHVGDKAQPNAISASVSQCVGAWVRECISAWVRECECISASVHQCMGA
jgi:hypothetical protein